MIQENKSSDNASARSRDHMANERTFLAWIRTSIGIMAFGFVVEKFSLFLRQLTHFFGKQSESDTLFLTHQKSSSIFGIFLVAMGALISLIAFLKYKKNERQIDEGAFRSSTVLASSLTLLVVVTGIFLVIYLVSS